ncbi:NRDE-2, necessary for RNA interference-domain-containing protein [Syncephalis plumigaleata]|nr:NRDE-2, necessary for RNA interference-domain-containing protein [Syncephalis plumigaleata]
MQYESMYKYDIPRYRTREVRAVLGAPLYARVVKGSHGEVVNLSITREAPLRSSKSFRYVDYADQFRTAALPVLSSVKDNELNTGDNDYIELPLDDTSTNDKDQYSMDTETSTPVDPIKEKLVQLERHVQQYPNDVDGWLRRIAFQDEQLTWSSNRKATARHALLEVKLAIYEKALEYCPEDERLLIGYMESGETIWDTSHLLNQWDDILKRHSDHLPLWIKYLNSYQHRSQVFKVTSCLGAYEQCIVTYYEYLWQHPEGREAIELSYVRVFQRACQLLYDSGYTERAISCYQAMIELSYFSPSSNELTLNTWEILRKQFEFYWEQGFPRIGQKNARGWWKYIEDDDEINSDSDDESSQRRQQSTKGTSSSWIYKEKQMEEDGILPTLDLSEDTDDPYRTVMFEDIQSLLFPPLVSNTAQSRLITGLTSLLGFTHCQPGQSSADLSRLDSYLHEEAINNRQLQQWLQLLIRTESIDDNDNDEQTASISSIGLPTFNYPQSLSLVVDEEYMNPVYTLPPLYITHFYRYMLIQLAPLMKHIHGYAVLITLLPMDDILLLLDTLRVTHLLDELGSLAYQCIQTRLSLASEDKIYKMAYNQLPQEIAFTGQWWSEMQALHLLMHTVLSSNRSMTTGEQQGTTAQWTPIQQLKARKIYHSVIDTEILAHYNDYLDDEQAVGIVGCVTLFEYLTRGISGAHQVYERVLTSLDEMGRGQSVRAELIQVQLYLIHQSICTIYRPGDFRDRLDDALARFPHNTFLLSAYLTNETRFKIENRMRRSLDDLLHRQSSHWLRLFSIYAELRYHPGQYNANRVRHLLDEAIEDNCGVSSVSLWTIYILFELQQNNLSRAKQIYLRAIRACPWHKGMYLLAYSILNQVFEEREQSEILELMMEKEIRLRILPE